VRGVLIGHVGRPEITFGYGEHGVPRRTVRG
jgi:hypothetical protein